MNILGIKGSISINGTKYSGNSIQINGDKIVIDEKEISNSDKTINLYIDGTVKKVESKNGTINLNGNAETVISKNGNISCNTILGDATSMNGNINIKNKITNVIEKEIVKDKEIKEKKYI